MCVYVCVGVCVGVWSEVYLFFSPAVVVDRRDDKNSDTGGFELAYKQVQLWGYCLPKQDNAH